MDKKTPVIENLDDSEFKKTLFQKYTVERPQEILNFIGDDKTLKSFLVEADKEILAYFPDATLYLDLFRDLEEERGTHIVLAVATKLKGDEAFEKFHALVKNWFSLVMNSLKGRLSINLESE